MDKGTAFTIIDHAQYAVSDQYILADKVLKHWQDQISTQPAAYSAYRH